MSTITRHNIHPQITFYQNKQDRTGFYQFDHDALISAVRQWKNILVEVAGIQAGHTVGVGSSLCDIRYLSLLYATTELGATLLVLDKPSSLDDPETCRCRVLAPFDLYLAWDESDPITKAMGSWFARQQLPFSLWHTHSSHTNSAADSIVASPTGVVMMAPTSGSTGTPKIVRYQHNWFDAIGERCQTLFDYRDSDRVLHLSNLHHGGSAGCFFFPTFRHCKHHYFEYGLDQSPGAMDRIVELVVQERINKIMFPNNLVLERFIKACPRVEHELKLFCLQANSPGWASHIQRANIHSVISFFGSTETLGPLFANIMTPDSGPDHNVLNYGKPLDSFFDINIVDHKLHVTDCFGNEHHLNDQFMIDSNDDFVFQSRSDLVRVNEVTLPMGQLDQLAERYFSAGSAALVADTTASKIYLLCDRSLEADPGTADKIKNISHDLAAIDPHLLIDFVDFADIGQFYNSVKLNKNAVTQHFRTTFHLL